MKKSNENRKKFHILLTVCLAFVVVIFDILFFVMPDRAVSETENRNLQLFPRLTWNTVTSGRFESQFDKYVADQFPGRDAWIAAETTVQRFAGNTLSNNIFLGSDGYLIKSFTDRDNDGYTAAVRKVTDVSEKHKDLRQYVLVAPGAISILDYRLPVNGAAVAGDEDRFIDNLLRDFSMKGLTAVDVRQNLRDMDASGIQVYYRTDHHWTTDAAYEAYKVFAEAAGITRSDVEYNRIMVTDSFQGTLTASSGFRTGETDSIYVYIPEDTGDENDQGPGVYNVINVDTGVKTASMYEPAALDTRDKYAVFFGGNHGELKIQTASASFRNILVLKDSYANCFVPFMTADFTNIIMVDPRYYLGDLDQLISDEEITDILYLYCTDSF
ncbi:MAG: hypothetical protein HUJ76_01940 [Parasporobacterium sp.]|nr:hypothetical protein [Parasporobacterium sp.]